MNNVGLPNWFKKDFRSACVSALVSLALSSIVTLFVGGFVAEEVVKREKKMVTVSLNNKGIGFPSILFEQASKDGYDLKFDPPNLQHVGVCEYYPARGVDFGDLAVSYIANYSQCFSLTRTSDKKYVIRPNWASGILREENGQFYCKCQF